MAWRKSPPELVEKFLAALPRDSRIERRQMFGYPAVFVNGNMFAGLHQEDVLVRLPEDERAALLREGGRRWEPTPGRAMAEYRLLPTDPDHATLARWIGRAFAYAASLPARSRKAPPPSPSRKRRNKR
ncbi:MAG: TfoX/Sxy family protein [Amphiplicatus sp.]